MFYVLTSDLSFYLFHEFNNSSNVMIIVYGVKKIKSFFSYGDLPRIECVWIILLTA